jgi:hypothetical protein
VLHYIHTNTHSFARITGGRIVLNSEWTPMEECVVMHSLGNVYGRDGTRVFCVCVCLSIHVYTHSVCIYIRGCVYGGVR